MNSRAKKNSMAAPVLGASKPADDSAASPNLKDREQREPHSPILPDFPFTPNAFSFSPPSLAFQGTQLSWGYMFTFKHAFFPPSSLSDILMAFAGLAFQGAGHPERTRFLCTV